MQWHPYFAEVLRPMLQEHYEVQTNVPVGDKPREADILVLRRKSRRPPFRGLWRILTPWNVLEFKGRTVSARVAHLPFLVEVGLGIHRRLNSERERAGEPLRPASDTSFWYVANHLGQRFLREAELLLGALEIVTNGVWRCQVMQHPILLVSSIDVPVERDSTPLHLLAEESPETEHELAQVIVNEPGLWEMYAPCLGSLHKNIWEEAKRMARSKNKTIEDYMDLQPVIDTWGLDRMVKAMGGVQEVIKAVDVNEVFKEIAKDEFLARLTPAQLRELQKRAGKRE